MSQVSFLARCFEREFVDIDLKNSNNCDKKYSKKIEKIVKREMQLKMRVHSAKIIAFFHEIFIALGDNNTEMADGFISAKNKQIIIFQEIISSDIRTM